MVTGALARGWWEAAAVKRANRLLIVGVLAIVVGAAALGSVWLLDRAASPDGPPQPPPVEEPDEPVDEPDDDPAAPVGPRESVLEHLAAAAGYEAVAFTLDFQGSVAALPQVGDRVNVYGRAVAAPSPPVDTDDEPTDPPVGDDGFELVLEDVTVVGVTGGSFEGNSGAPTVVLAVPRGEVSSALRVHRSSAVHMSLVGSDSWDPASSPSSEVDAS